MDGFQPFKFHKKLNVVAYQNFTYLLPNFFNRNCIRIIFQSILSSQKQTCINCETQNPHSRHNCGRISVTQVAQETQGGNLPEFHLSSCYNFTKKKSMRIKSRAFLSQKQTCISSCGNPKPSFQTQLWTDFSHSSSTRSSTWFTYQNFL